MQNKNYRYLFDVYKETYLLRKLLFIFQIKLLENDLSNFEQGKNILNMNDPIGKHLWYKKAIKTMLRVSKSNS